MPGERAAPDPTRASKAPAGAFHGVSHLPVNDSRTWWCVLGQHGVIMSLWVSRLFGTARQGVGARLGARPSANGVPIVVATLGVCIPGRRVGATGRGAEAGVPWSVNSGVPLGPPSPPASHPPYKSEAG